jgi:hypothetical protein
MTHIFGPFVGAHHLEAAVLNVLWTWLPTYQHEIAREAGLVPSYLPPVRSYRVVSELSRMPEDQVPSVLLANNGVLEPPFKHGDSVYVATWEVDIGVQVVAKGARLQATPRALTLARMYLTAIRLAVIQQRDTGGVIHMTDWWGERPSSVLEAEDDRTTCLASTRFHITTEGAAQWGEGPTDPLYPPEDPDNPPVDRPEWPIADSYVLDIANTQTPEEG